jgi:hypothetical protein
MKPTIVDWSEIPPDSSSDTVHKRRFGGLAAELVLQPERGRGGTATPTSSSCR